MSRSAFSSTHSRLRWGIICMLMVMQAVLTPASPAHAATTIAQWTFDNDTTSPSVGAGSISLVGGATATFATGTVGPRPPDSGWNTTTYPAQGAGDRTRGIQIAVNTAGFTNITLSFDQRNSGTAANTLVVQYSTDNTTFTDVLTFTTSVSNTFNARNVDLSSISAVNNIPTVTLRLVTAFAASTAAFAPTQGASYATNGTIRYDNVTITGDGVVPDVPPTVSSTTPANSATNVATNSTIAITFSEAVTVTGNWFTLNCATSGLRNVADTAVTGGPALFTIDPTVNFAAGESCTMTVIAAQVADQDSTPNNMAADYVFTFSTQADVPPTVSSTTPANSATGVALNSNVVINFSEAVTVTGSWFNIACASSGTRDTTNTVVSGGPASFTIDPNADFIAGETCTATVVAANVSDQDEPLNNMAADYNFSFAALVPSCTLAATPIGTVQGETNTSPFSGTVKSVKGVVVGDYEGPSPNLRGFYLQDAGDGNPATSDGIFVFNFNNTSVTLGSLISVTGQVQEFQGQTQVSNLSGLELCSTGNTVTPTDVSLPFTSADYLERYEGMLVRFPQTLHVTEHFQLGRFGQIVASSGDRLQQPTSVITPGAPALAIQAQNNLNKIIIDDALNNQNPDPIVFGRGGNPLSAANTLRGGDTFSNAVGVLVYTWAGNAASPNAYRLRPVDALTTTIPAFVQFAATNSRPPAQAALSGTLKVTGLNLLNFFNTFGNGNCTLGVGGAATDCRGAESQTEFDRQWPKTVANVTGTGADVVGIGEIENDGYGAQSAIQTLIDKLNAATAPNTYAFINVDAQTGMTNALGNDAIKVGFVYKPATVTPVSNTAALNTGAFGQFNTGAGMIQRNRPALAQAFQHIASGEVVIVAVNHLKSKGSACSDNISPVGPDPDAGDGQGNCNLTRKAAAQELAAWLATNPTGSTDPDVLIVGDLNSYAKEDPITALVSAGYTNLIEQKIGANAYSYAFDGQWGYLDHALASASLTAKVAEVMEWHINADEPSVLDYNTNFKSAGQQASLFAPDAFRSSDHDPVIVGITAQTTPPPEFILYLPLMARE